MSTSPNGVAVFRFEMGLPSEAFIGEQAASLQRYHPSFWGRDLAGTPWGSFRHHACDRFGPKVGKLFAAYPAPFYFREPQALRESALIHAHFGPDACFALPLAERFALPLVTTFHGYDVLTDRTRLAKLGGFRVKRFLAQEGRLKQAGARFVAVSRFVQGALIRLGYPEARIVQHYIGVDVERFKPRSAEPLGDRPYFLSVARHVEFKGIDTLLKAFAQVVKRFPEARLLQVGTGPLFEQNKALATSLGLDGNVEFMGRQPHQRVRELMAGALAFCGPSQTAADGGGEALGIVFCEASASGVPVVSTLHGGIPEIVVHGETGLLVPEAQPAALGDALAAVLADDTLRLSLGRAGRIRMETFFDIRKQGPALELIYDEVLKK